MSKRIIVVTGVSGSGKTSAIKALEDLGFFCVDNLPQEFFYKFLELAEKRDVDVALGIDVRSHVIGSDFKNFFQEMKGRIEVLFIEASKEIIMRRFGETRRKHPIPHVKNLQEGIEKELQWIQELRQYATDIIDTTNLNIHELRRFIRKKYGSSDPENTMQINLVSFGYRHGIPLDTDIVIDTRCLPNPHYKDELRKFTGKDKEVIEYLEKEGGVSHFLNLYYKVLSETIPLYEKEGKAYLTIAIGCTGGHHRSVYVALKLQEFFKKNGYNTQLSDRDIYKN
ncbi:MAG: RNase adapter RapZ [Deltaproteobacteria bacterium]|nr:RNase adapter RapZ [Deltaproteobacteria bacterium]